MVMVVVVVVFLGLWVWFVVLVVVLMVIWVVWCIVLKLFYSVVVDVYNLVFGDLVYCVSVGESGVVGDL